MVFGAVFWLVSMNGDKSSNFDRKAYIGHYTPLYSIGSVTMKDTKPFQMSKDAHATLKRLSELSGMTMDRIVSEWLRSVQAVLDTFEGDFNRISLLSTRQEPDNVSVTFLGAIYTGQVPLRDLTKIPSDNEASRVETERSLD